MKQNQISKLYEKQLLKIAALEKMALKGLQVSSENLILHQSYIF